MADVKIYQYVLREYETGTGLDCLDGKPPEDMVGYAIEHCDYPEIVGVYMDRQEAETALQQMDSECMCFQHSCRIKIYAIEVFGTFEDGGEPTGLYITTNGERRIA